MNKIIPISLLYIVLLVLPFSAQAQEENVTAVTEGTHYFDFKLKDLTKYQSRLENEQKHLLNKLKRKEARLAHKLKHTDSVAYVRLKQQPLTYDSISKLNKQPDSSSLAQAAKKKNKFIDSLKGVQSFVQTNEAKLSQSPLGTPNANTQIPGNNSTAELTQLQGQLNYRTYINDLITQRTNNLQSLGAGSNLGPLTGIQKQVFYGKAKMNAFKEMEEDPSKAEDKALEYLEGTPGFDQSMNNAQSGASGMQSLTGNESDGDLQKMGYQTKSQVQAGLQQKFGGNLGNVSKQMGQAVSQFQDKMNDLSQLKQTKQSLTQLKNTDKPSFKINPMRGMPFWKRIQKQYNWQTMRPNAPTPALLNISAMAGYKQSKKLTYGLGIIGSFGLGQSWSDIHPSFQGLGLRSYMTWQWQYGIGIYAGYERVYKQAVFTNTTSVDTSTAAINPHNTNNYTESVLVGLTKNYNINAKWNGQIQVLYDIWWKEKNLPSPIVLRFATISK